MKVLLAGYYGFNNIGDELLGETAKNILQKHSVRVSVLNRQKRHLNTIPKMIKDCDIFLFGGGSLFQDVTGRGLTVLYYFILFQLARIYNKKVFFIAQGIGPITHHINYWLIKICLRQVNYLTVRNKESAAFLMALGITKFKTYNDLLFAFTPPAFVKKKDNRKISVVFSFRPFHKDYHEQLCRLMERISSVLKNIEISVVPMQKPQDETLINSLKKINTIKIVPFDQQKIFQAIATADLAIGMRLHFLILAAKYHVPFIGIIYDPKITGICKTLDMPYVYFSDLDTIGTTLVNELPKLGIRRNTLENNYVGKKHC
jgi:polysaccharide pyruvyl transferase CsaB